MIWLPTHLLLRVVFIIISELLTSSGMISLSFYPYFICLSHMFRFGAWFFQYKLSFLTTRFPSFLLLWRCEVTPWLMDAFWVPRVHRLVGSDAPALHTGGSSYHNRFSFSNFESSLFKNSTVALLPPLLKNFRFPSALFLLTVLLLLSVYRKTP